MSQKYTQVEKALDDVAEIASSLRCHGAGGHSVGMHLDYALVKALERLHAVLSANSDGNVEAYDPDRLIATFLYEGRHGGNW